MKHQPKIIADTIAAKAGENGEPLVFCHGCEAYLYASEMADTETFYADQIADTETEFGGPCCSECVGEFIERPDPEAEQDAADWAQHEREELSILRIM